MDQENEVKIDKDDQNAVRIALDDAAKQVYLLSLKVNQSDMNKFLELEHSITN